MHRTFPLFSNHLTLAHYWWRHLLQVGDCVLDATCGKGGDTEVLASCVLDDQGGEVWALDKQPQALTVTQARLAKVLTGAQMARLKLLQGDHAAWPQVLLGLPLKLAVYNLGYLPGGDKQLTTTAASTLASLAAVLPQIIPGGAISIMCYIGHAGGQEEYEAILQWASQLEVAEWNSCCHRWVNAAAAPLWLLLQRGCRKE